MSCFNIFLITLLISFGVFLFPLIVVTGIVLIVKGLHFYEHRILKPYTGFLCKYLGSELVE